MAPEPSLQIAMKVFSQRLIFNYRQIKYVIRLSNCIWGTRHFLEKWSRVAKKASKESFLVGPLETQVRFDAFAAHSVTLLSHLRHMHL